MEGRDNRREKEGDDTMIEKEGRDSTRERKGCGGSRRAEGRDSTKERREEPCPIEPTFDSWRVLSREMQLQVLFPLALLAMLSVFSLSLRLSVSPIT